MTFLIENEEAALVVPARLLGQLHPHFREVHAAARRPGRRRGPAHRGVHPAGARCTGDAARHLRRRAGARRCRRCSTSPTSRIASFLLSVLGEGTLPRRCSASSTRHAPDPVTADDRPPRRAGRGPPRRVRRRATSSASAPIDPTLRGRARALPSSAATTRCATPPGSTTTSSTRSSCSPPARATPDAIAPRLATRRRRLQREMDEGRRRRLRPPRLPDRRGRPSSPRCTPATSCELHGA